MLSDHYKTKDLALVMQEYERIFSATQKMLQMADSAQFEQKEEVLSEIKGAFENLFILNRKKLDTDSVQEINEQTRQLMF